MFQDEDGNHVSVEVAMMVKLRSAGHSAPVSMLDWYDLDQELILVLERPVPAVDLYDYIEANRGPLQEEKAKVSVESVFVCSRHVDRTCSTFLKHSLSDHNEAAAGWHQKTFRGANIPSGHQSGEHPYWDWHWCPTSPSHWLWLELLLQEEVDLHHLLRYDVWMLHLLCTHLKNYI